MAQEKSARYQDECGETQAKCMDTVAPERGYPHCNYLRTKASEMRKEAGRQMAAASELEVLADYLCYSAPLPQDILRIIMNQFSRVRE